MLPAGAVIRPSREAVVEPNQLNIASTDGLRIAAFRTGSLSLAASTSFPG